MHHTNQVDVTSVISLLITSVYLEAFCNRIMFRPKSFIPLPFTQWKSYTHKYVNSVYVCSFIYWVARIMLYTRSQVRVQCLVLPLLINGFVNLGLTALRCRDH